MRRESAEDYESKVARERRGGTVGFGKTWRNFEYEMPNYDRRTELGLQRALSRKQKLQMIQFCVVLSSVIYLILAHVRLSQMLLMPFKTLPVGLMILMVLTLGDRREYGTRVALGLLFCAVGDACLALEESTPEWKHPLFLVGLGSGLIGHCSYASAFFSQAPVTFRTAALPVALAGVVFYLLRPRLPEDLLVPVFSYIVVAGATMALALSRKPDGFSALWSWRCGSAGALLFAVSDTLLAYDRFVGPVPQAKLLVAATYLLAQFLIAMSARGSQPRPLSKALGSVENFQTGHGFRVMDE